MRRTEPENGPAAQEAVATQQEVVEVVQRHLNGIHPGDADLQVVSQGVRHDQEWWYVPVRPSVQPARRYEYYEALANVERELQMSENLTVLLVPTVPDTEQAGA